MNQWLFRKVILSGSRKWSIALSKTQFTSDEAVDVWLRHWSGQHQHHIAADYRINAGRVSEVLTEKKHVGSRRVAAARFNKSA